MPDVNHTNNMGKSTKENKSGKQQEERIKPEILANDHESNEYDRNHDIGERRCQVACDMQEEQVFPPQEAVPMRHETAIQKLI
jgi:hypothetical protein